jgi:hypothetical protein
MSIFVVSDPDPERVVKVGFPRALLVLYCHGWGFNNLNDTANVVSAVSVTRNWFPRTKWHSTRDLLQWILSNKFFTITLLLTLILTTPKHNYTYKATARWSKEPLLPHPSTCTAQLKTKFFLKTHETKKMVDIYCETFLIVLLKTDLLGASSTYYTFFKRGYFHLCQAE